MDINELREKTQELLTTLTPEIAELNPSGDNIPPVEACIANTHAMLDSLDSFFREDSNTTYLPIKARNRLHNELQTGFDRLHNLSEAPDPDRKMQCAKDALVQFDDLYSLAVQNRILSSGLDDKTIQARLRELSSITQQVRDDAQELSADITKAAEAAKQQIVQTEKDMTTQTEAFTTETTKSLEAVTSTAAEATVHLTAMEGDAQLAQKFQQDISTLRANAETQGDEAAALLKTIETTKNEATAQKDAAQKDAHQTAAHQKQASEAWATFSTQLDEIKAFYSEIEEHQNAMIDVRKTAEAHFGELKTNCDAATELFGKRTEEILTKNEGFQSEIKQHLERAVGVSLFKAFDHRRRSLRTSKWIWAGILMLAVGAVVGLSIWVVWSLNSQPDAMVIMRLAIMAPAIFLLAFSASQYAKERKAEEEYAFKSTISVSLRPYYDLVDSIRKEDAASDIPYLEALITEVFDNPVARIHSKDRPSRPEQSLVNSIIKCMEAGKEPADILKEIHKLVK